MKHTKPEMAETLLENGIKAGGLTLINCAKSAYDVLVEYNKKPNQINTLTAERDALKEEIVELKKYKDMWENSTIYEEADVLQKERDALRAEVEELKAQREIKVIVPPLPGSLVISALQDQVKEYAVELTRQRYGNGELLAEIHRLRMENYKYKNFIDDLEGENQDGK